MEAKEIKALRKKLGLNQTEFGERIGVGLRSVQNYEKGKTKPSADVLMKLLELNANNDAHNGDKEKPDPEAIWVNFSTFKAVPLVGQRAQAGFLAGWGDPEYLEELPKVPFEVDREYKGRYICFEVAGESMDDGTTESILENDILLCREVQKHHWKNHLHINQWDFVLVHRTEGILVKRIVQHDTETGKLVLHSLNPLYDDQEVYMNDLIAIFNVVDIKRNKRRR